MWGWFNRKKRREERHRLETLRQERGKLAEAVMELGRKRHAIEELMKRMLDERNHA